ncbi:hypothetical protein GGF31_001860 [Allomyces arbusculus]|nr:hypothetical protein GGF31_001860 [Allomyces arbusculus]
MIAWLAQQLQAPWASTSPPPARPSSPDLNDDDDIDPGVRVDMWAGASPSAPASSAVPELTTKVRVVVVGERGTGKSSLVRYLTDVPTSARVTAPRSADAAPVGGGGKTRGRAGEADPRHVFTGVRLHYHAASAKHVWVEFVTAPPSIGARARTLVAAGVHGILGVHDLSQPRTRDAAERAVRAVQASAGGTVPVLLVGTKSDLVPGFLSQQQLAQQQAQAAARQQQQHYRDSTRRAAPTLALDPPGTEGRPHTLAMSMDAPPPPEAFAPFLNQVIAMRWPSVGTGSSAYRYDQQHALTSPTMGAATILPRSPVLGPPRSPLLGSAHGSSRPPSQVGVGASAGSLFPVGSVAAPMGLGLGLAPTPGPRSASRGSSDATASGVKGTSIGPEPLPVLVAPPEVPLGGALGMQRAGTSSSAARAGAADEDAWRR